MSTTVVINEVPKFNLSVQQGDGPAVTLSQPDAPALTLSMSGPQGPTGATGAAGPNSVTSSTTSDGTGTLSLSSLSLSTPLPLASGGTGGATASAARTNLGLGTADTPTFSNLTLATGTITVPQPLAFSQTWNSTATFTALQMNITDSGPANAASLLMDLRVGGSSVLKASKTGSLTTGRFATTGFYGVEFDSTAGNIRFSRSSDGGIISTLNIGSNSFQIGTLVTSNGNLWFSSGGDLQLTRDAANTLAQRNGTNAQESRVYGTYTSATNFERLNLKYNGTATAFQIGTEKGSAGGVARPLELQTNGTTRATITTVGDLLLTNTWNSSIAVTGASGNGTTATLTFATQSVAIPVGSTIVVTGVNPSGYNTTGATVTASTTTSVSYANATTAAWVSGGTIQQLFTAIRADITDTSSASGSLLMDLRVGGVSKFSVQKDGATAFSNNLLVNAGSLYVSGIVLDRSNQDIVIDRSSAGTIRQRSGVQKQSYHLHDTFTSSTDYHRLAIATARATATAMSGATITLTNIIPAGAVVVGVTCKVTTAITGATSFDIGTATDVDRFGAAIAVALGTTSDNRDWTAGTVECFPTATSLILTANGSNFTAGAVYVSVQYLSGQAD